MKRFCYISFILAFRFVDYSSCCSICDKNSNNGGPNTSTYKTKTLGEVIVIGMDRNLSANVRSDFGNEIQKIADKKNPTYGELNAIYTNICTKYGIDDYITYFIPYGTEPNNDNVEIDCYFDYIIIIKPNTDFNIVSWHHDILSYEGKARSQFISNKCMGEVKKITGDTKSLVQYSYLINKLIVN